MTPETPTPDSRPLLVSVIMPCFKMGRFVGEALDSVGAQNYAHWEIIAVDDAGPDDGTATAIRAFTEQFPTHRILLIRHEQNAGMSAARNTAIRASVGQVLAFLDPDDLWYPDHLKHAVGAFHAGPAVSLVAGAREIFFQDNPGRFTETWHIDRWQRDSFPASLAATSFITPSTVLVRKDHVLAIGGFDPDLTAVADYDLWIRLAKARYQFHFHDRATTRYRMHETSASRDRGEMDRLRELLYSKHLLFFLSMQGKLITSIQRELQATRHAADHPVQWLGRRLRRRLAGVLHRRWPSKT